MTRSDGVDVPNKFPFGIIIELFFYELASILMILSHSAVMCREPGFVPKNYEYDDAKLPFSFKIGLKGKIDVIQEDEHTDRKRNTVFVGKKKSSDIQNEANMSERS